MIENAGKDILTFILKRGAMNSPTTPPGICLNQYLDQLPATSSANYARMTRRQKNYALTHTDLQHIESSPMWDTFDVTLLHKVIRLACENVAGIDDPEWHNPNMLEGLVTRIRDERNAIFREVRVFSEAEYEMRVRELENLFDETLNTAKIRYQIPDADMIPVKDKIQHGIDTFRKNQLGKELVMMSLNSMQQEFMRVCQNKLKSIHNNLLTFDPVSFLTYSPQHQIHIQDIFCRMDLVKIGGWFQEKQDINIYDILTVTRHTEQNPQPSTSSSTPSMYGKSPQLIVIKGFTGSGKTTLLTYLLSEWLKDPDDCTIRHLHEYDIVLRILCRENDSPSLQDFLRQIMSNYFAEMEESVIFLLRCKVLFLIDGLDVSLPGSRSKELVVDILNKVKYFPNCTLICTTRPEMRDDFLAKVPGYYQVWNMEIKSVSPEQRTQFVLKHYASLPDNGNKDPEKLKYLMDCLGWNDFFSLPLNLLCVAILFHMNPNNIKVTTTQTSLHVTIQDWCIQKLQARLSDHSKDNRTHEEDIRELLKDMEDVALRGLLQDQITLSKEDERYLWNSFRNKGLPSSEVFSAFFNLIDIRERWGYQSRYSVPHESIQNFYSASGIVNKVVNDSHSRNIRHMLHNPPPCQLRKLRNLLRHVAGLLCHPQTPLCTAAIQEVVDLLAETGMKDCNDWLSVLEDTEVNRIALACVVKYITRDKEVVKVTDNTINSAKALLPIISSKEVWIDLCRKESDMQGLIFEHHQYTELSLNHQYKHPDQVNHCDSLLCATPRCCLRVFKGHLSTAGTQLLQECQDLKVLHLAVCDQNAQGVLSVIRAIHPSLPRLSSLVLHIPIPAVRTDRCTMRLPDGLQVSLVLSGMNKKLLEKAARIAQALQPTMEGWRAIMFPGSSMTADVLQCLLEKLATAGVKVWSSVEGTLDGGILVPETSPITEEEERNLSSLAKTMSLGCLSRKSEDLMEVESL